MTVGSQVKQCFYSLKGVQENLKSLAIRSSSQIAKDELNQASAILREVTDDINKRISELEKEEPQYKGN